MKKILQLCIFLLLTTSTLGVFAQERTVSGKVTSVDDGSPIPGVNVVLKGTTNGAVTDGDGNYRISIAGGNGTLVFTFIGFKTIEVAVGERTTVDISLEQDVQQLNEVVVTALGITRDARSIAYANQQVSNEKLVIARSNNIADALAGKVAGIQVRGQSGGKLGSNAAIRIRGNNGLEEKGPLYILDGTPIEDSNDINPDDIESTTILKGPAATAVYGQRGDAGVILLTSKKAKKGSGGITINQNYFVEKVYVLPRFQNSYAGGSFADLAKFTYQPGMPTEWQALDGKYYHDYTDDGSWGPRMVGQEYIPWYAWVPGTKYTGKTEKLLPQPNNIRDFYGTGTNRVTNVAFTKAEDNYNIRVSYTNQGQVGILPNTGLTKNTFSTQLSTDLNKVVTVGANVNYVNTQINGEFDDGYSNATSGSFNQWFHRNLDVNKLKELSNLKSPEGRLVSWNHFNPQTYLTSGDKFYRGYYWWNPQTYMELIDYQTNRQRLSGDFNVKFNITDKINLQLFYRKNEVSSRSENKRPSILPYSFYTELRPTSQAQYDFYGTDYSYDKEDNAEFLATYNDSFLNDDLSLSFNVGGNIRMEEFGQNSSSTNLGLVVPDLFTLSNSKVQPFFFSNFRARKEVRSIYARGNFGYKDIVFVEWSARNDWSSALRPGNNSYFYPMVGTSFVFSELTESTLPFLSLGKIRASVAQTGSDTDAYFTSLVYGLGDQWSGNATSGVPNRLPDPNIQPSLSTSYEAGLDLKFWQNKLGLAFTWYQTNNTNGIVPVSVSSASGFSSRLINAAEVQNSGVEIELNAIPVKTGDFEWNTALNIGRNINKTISLAPGIDAIPQNGGNNRDAFGIATIFNVAGQAGGQIRGFGIQKIDGKPVLNDNGTFATVQNADLGSNLPDFTGGFLNTLTYKAFSLTANIDFQSGGKFFSLSDWFGTFSGLTERTAQLNDRGIPERTAVADGGGVRVIGVDENGEAVDTYVEGKVYYQQFVNNSIAENSVYDLTFVKLREVNLQYRIPVAKLGVGNFIRSASISLVGRDLWLMYSKVKDFDPSVISNTFGENGQFPGTRNIGFNLKLGF
jgi:TonB-linked SusC/RagA family outer membrane protein